jgi:hypothetical protein
MYRVGKARKGRCASLAAGIAWTCAWTCLTLGSSLSAGGATATSTQLADPTVGEDGDYGRSVAVSSDGTAALVGGAGADCPGGFHCGRAFVFSRQGGAWAGTAELALPDGAAFDDFGWGVALSADAATALIGAPGRDCPAGNGCGAVYAFEFQGGVWIQRAELTAVGQQADASFGTAVVLSADGGTALIMAPSEHDAAHAGALYIFTRTGSSWSQTGKLTVPASVGLDFGWRATLSQDGGTILASVRELCSGGGFCGAGYVYVRSGGTWVQQARLAVPPSDPAPVSDPSAPAGRPVALSADGGIAVLGVLGDFCGNGTCGAAYVFQRNGSAWSEPQKITAAGTRSGDLFGSTLALSGDGETLWVGAQGTDGLADPLGEPDHGAVYGFTRSAEGFVLRQSILSPEGRHSLFPAHLALSQDGTTAVTGIPHARRPTAYAFSITGAVQDVPTLSGAGLAALAVLLAACGALALRCRATST